jgi:chromosome segregation ATPase
MKGTRLIILVLSILLLTISSGLLFYKNLFQVGSLGHSGKVNFEELRYTEMQINATAAMLRFNLSADSAQLESEVTRIRELINIVTDVNNSTSELSQSVTKIRAYFDHKIADLNNFQTALKELKTALNSLNPAYNELNKNKIKFTVDNRDFYRECVIDALLYVTYSDKDHESRLSEDKKILSQIISFASAPNPTIQKFSAYIDIILKRTREIDRLTESFNTVSSINNELSIVGKYYKEAEEARTHDGEIFLSMVFGAILLYLISVVVIFRKLT